MPRKKNYVASTERLTQLGEPTHQREGTDAVVDMSALLGPQARLGKRRAVDLSEWLGRGIDEWVHGAARSMRSMLLSGSRQAQTIASYGNSIQQFFAFLTERPGTPAAPLPSELGPLHIRHFIGWLQRAAQTRAWGDHTPRGLYHGVKAILIEMLSLGLIQGEASRLFPRGAIPWRTAQSRQTSLSDAEQTRLAGALRKDLVDLHHGRLSLKSSEVQALRLLLVAHRQGLNTTPLLEMRRGALAPGVLPGTIRIRTEKHRNKKIRGSVGRATDREQDLVFTLSEGAVLQQAISSSEPLLHDAPEAIRGFVWLYRSEGGKNPGQVACVTDSTLFNAIRSLVQRHDLRGDDAQPLRINLTRLRKSFFDRALRIADGDIAVTANLMGNTPQVASVNYPSMNIAREAEAANFMNDDYVATMRAPATLPKLIPVRVVDERQSSALVATPVAGCADSLSGDHAPKDGHNHCDQFVMCLFCSSFAIAGSVAELWRLFSFQAFAREELAYLDRALGPERTADTRFEDLRDRYRLAIPFIDDFTSRQFAASRITAARDKCAARLHPFWEHQAKISRAARVKGDERNGD